MIELLVLRDNRSGRTPPRRICWRIFTGKRRLWPRYRSFGGFVVCHLFCVLLEKDDCCVLFTAFVQKLLRSI